MPNLWPYGLKVTLNTPDAPLPESSARECFFPSKGMTHPIYTSTSVAPSRPEPLTINLHLSSAPIAEHLAGDLRIEVLLNNIPIALKVHREVKIRGNGKGFNSTFTGFRIGRTEERGFLVSDDSNARKKRGLPEDIPNLGYEWTEKKVQELSEDPNVAEGDCPCLVPRYPGNVPDGVSY